MQIRLGGRLLNVDQAAYDRDVPVHGQKRIGDLKRLFDTVSLVSRATMKPGDEWQDNVDVLFPLTVRENNVRADSPGRTIIVAKTVNGTAIAVDDQSAGEAAKAIVSDTHRFGGPEGKIQIGYAAEDGSLYIRNPDDVPDDDSNLEPLEG